MLKPVFLGALLTGFTLISASLVMAESQGNLVVSEGWTTPALTKDASIAVYLTLENTGKETVVLKGASSDIAEQGMIHQTMEHDGVSHMQHLSGLEVAAGHKVAFKPGGLHVMLMGLNKQLKEGDNFSLTLDVEEGEDITLPVVVKSLAEKAK